MHGDVGLSTIGMTENFMAPGLSGLFEAGAEELGQDLTRGEGHPESRCAL